jgi:glycosyltransferase involved in cell wall biosynthesis
MNYIILGDTFSFPEGEAATNRIHTYVKGLNENRLKNHVVCFANEYNNVGDGIINGIYYYYPFGQRKRNKYFIIRSLRKIFKYYNAFLLIKKINKNDNIIALHCDTHFIGTFLFAFALSKYFKTNFILEQSEHPLRNYQDSIIKKMLGNAKTYLEIKLCDGIFCISQYLVDFYKNRGMSPKKLFLVPSTVDTERFNNQYFSPLPFQYILYCGNLNKSKDGVDILIESFSKISGRYPEINLVLIGRSDTIIEEEDIRSLSAKLNTHNRVYFLGQLSRNEVPAYMTNAKILALARPKSMIADAGFPSKLTEYLATGIPLVVTKVGEIPVYLKDNKNAFITDPDSIYAFAEKLSYVLDNYEFAKEVSIKGQELTQTVFNYSYQAKRIIQFLETINNSERN